MFEEDLSAPFRLLHGNRLLEGWESWMDTHERFLSREKIRRERGIFPSARRRCGCALAAEKPREHVWPKEILIIKNRGI